MGKPGLADDARYVNNNASNKHEKLLRTEISEWTESKTTEEILTTLNKAEVPCAPLWSLGQAVASSHQQTRKLIEEGIHSKFGKIPLVPQPVRFSGKSVQNPQQVPLLGEHTEAVLRKLLGKTKDEMNVLRQDGVI